MKRLYGENGMISRRGVLHQMGTVALTGNAAWLATGTSAEGQAGPVRAVAFGDSLTAGYQLKPQEAFPAQLQAALQARGHAIEIANAGVSGDTTSAARERLAWAVPDGTEAVIVALGGNDMLRGLDPAKARENLDAILSALKKQGAEILLAGMIAPRSMGEAYTKPFDAIFPELAQRHGTLLYPFFVEPIALKPELNLADGIHPNAKGVQAMVAGILPKVEELVGRVKARRAAKG